jgi:hypothetical protein
MESYHRSWPNSALTARRWGNSKLEFVTAWLKAVRGRVASSLYCKAMDGMDRVMVTPPCPNWQRGTYDHGGRAEGKRTGLGSGLLWLGRTLADGACKHYGQHGQENVRVVQSH